MDDLQLIALECRKRVEAVAGPDSHVSFQSFPRGSCGDASDLLARLLVERHGLDAKVAIGVKDGHQSHAWVVLSDMIVDITADQFAGQPPVFVGEGSLWHATWDSTVRPHFGPASWPTYPYDIWYALTK